jgi:predicted O-methyltransferase YrrM
VPAPAPTATLSDALAAVRSVEGWLTDDQAQRLWDQAQRLQPGQRIVEIGSFRGRSAIVLALAAAPGVEVVAIDPHAGNDRGPDEIEGYFDEAAADYDVFHRNLRAAGVEDRVRHVRLPSQEALAAVDGPVDLLYVDGAHRYTPALADLRAWGARVAPDGTLLVHDSFSAVGVTLALGREMFAGSRWYYFGRSTSMAEYRRVTRPLTGVERVRNGARQAAQLPWFVRCQVLKVLIRAGREDWARKLGHTTGPWPY